MMPVLVVILFMSINQYKSGLKCENCGNMIPMACSHMEELYDHVLEEHSFQVNPHRTMFYGMCNECMERKNKNEN